MLWMQGLWFGAVIGAAQDQLWLAPVLLMGFFILGVSPCQACLRRLSVDAGRDINRAHTRHDLGKARLD